MFSGNLPTIHPPFTLDSKVPEFLVECQKCPVWNFNYIFEKVYLHLTVYYIVLCSRYLGRHPTLSPASPVHCCEDWLCRYEHHYNISFKCIVQHVWLSWFACSAMTQYTSKQSETTSFMCIFIDDSMTRKFNKFTPAFHTFVLLLIVNCVITLYCYIFTITESQNDDA